MKRLPSVLPSVCAMAALVTFPPLAQAEQFIVADVEYTHSADSTTDSHYHVSPAAGSPTNWKSPVDYTLGSAHVLLEVKTKPTATPTKFQICFEGTPSYACTSQSIAYTAPGKYEWTTPFSSFYMGGTVDWSVGIKKVALILKDTENNKPQGDPQYVPTDLRVEVAILSQGATYVAPMRDAGVAPDAGSMSKPARDAGPADAAIQDSGARDAGPLVDASSTADAATVPAADPLLDAGARPSATADASSAPGRDAAGDEDETSPEDEGSGGGCRLTVAGDASVRGWLLLPLALLLARMARRRRSAIRR